MFYCCICVLWNVFCKCKFLIGMINVFKFWNVIIILLNNVIKKWLEIGFIDFFVI